MFSRQLLLSLPLTVAVKAQTTHFFRSETKLAESVSFARCTAVCILRAKYVHLFHTHRKKESDFNVAS